MIRKSIFALLLVLVMLSCFTLVACNNEEGGDKNFVDPSEWDNEDGGEDSSGDSSGDDEGIRGDAADSSAIELPKVPY